MTQASSRGDAALDQLQSGFARFVQQWQQTRQDGVGAPQFYTAIDPVQVIQSAPLYSSPNGLLRTSNAAFNKLGGVLAYVSYHLQRTSAQAERDVYPMLAVMNKHPVNRTRSADNNQLHTAFWLVQQLEKWQQIAKLVSSLSALLLNLLEQLGALCAAQTRKSTVLQGERATAAFAALGSGLAVTARIDALIVENRRIKPAFSNLQRILSQSEQGQDPRLQAAVSQIQEAVAGKGIFRQFLDQHLVHSSHIADACASSGFLSAMGEITRAEVGRRVDRIVSKAEHSSDRRSLLDWLCLGVLHCHLCSEGSYIDRKMLRLLTRLHQQIPLIPIYMSCTCQPAAFLSLYLPASIDAYLPARYTSQAAALRVSQLEQLMQPYISDQDATALSVIAWQARLSDLLAPQRFNDLRMSQLASAAVEGMRLRAALLAEVQSILALHTLIGAGLPPVGLQALMRRIVLAKAIESTFSRHGMMLAEMFPQLTLHCKSKLQGQLEAVIASLKAKTRGAQAATLRRGTIAAIEDACTVADAAIHVLHGPVSTAHMAAVDQCLDALHSTGVAGASDRARIDDLLQTLHAVAFKAPRCHEAGSCAFLHSHPRLVSAAMKDLMARPYAAARLQYTISAFADADSLLQHAGPCAEPLQQDLQHRLLAAVTSEVLEPVAAQVETNLRRQLPAAKEAANAPGPAAEPGLHVTQLLRLGPLRIMHKHVHIRRWVQDKLQASFHSYAASAPSEWQTYALMASLAEHQYGLHITAPALPRQTADQGMNVAELIQDFSSFAAGVGYSASPQEFLEITHESRQQRRYLKALLPRHMQQALWTHGTGLAEAAVRAAVFCIAGCLAALAQWLQVDGVAARLHKEAASAQDEADRDGILAAHSLAADMLLLGAAPNGQSQLQYLRSLLTRIGNAVGFVRMVRRGLLELASADRQLCPSTLVVPPVAPPFEGREDCADILDAAAALDQVLQQKAVAPLAGPDYLSVIVAMLTQRLTGMSQLAHFHAAVPAVTLAWIEARLLAKEQLSHARRATALAAAAGASETTAFMDDGFAFGLALTLQVLGQGRCVNVKRWFTVIQAHFTAASQPEAGAEQPVSALPIRIGKWLLSTVGLGSSPTAPPAAPSGGQSGSAAVLPGFGQASASSVPQSGPVATHTTLDSLAAQLQEQQQQPALAYAAHIQTAQAKASATEALHLARTFETAHVLLSSK